MSLHQKTKDGQRNRIGIGNACTSLQCGIYKIAVPVQHKGEHDQRMLVLLDGKPVLWRLKNETLLYDPNPKHADFSHPIVNVQNGNNRKGIKQLWYQALPDKEGRYVTTFDRVFYGVPDTRVIKKVQNNKIIYLV